jgi:epsilon-lactone hydrolase
MSSFQFHFFRSLMRLARWSQGRFPYRDPAAFVRFRRIADRAANAVMRPTRDVRVESGSAGEAAGDRVIPAGVPDNPVMLFLHGGGMAFGWNNPMRRELAFLCKTAGLRAFGVDFPLIPDYVYPAAHDVCYAAYRALVQDGRQVVLTGESSGAVLALAIMLRAKAAGLPQPRLCALISPVVDYGMRDERIWQTNDAFAHPKFTVETLKHYVAGNDPSLPDLAPVLADLEGIAPLLVLAGESELCRSEVDRLAGAAQRHHVPMETILWPRVWHSWHALVPQLPEAVQALEAFGAAIRRRVMA